MTVGGVRASALKHDRMKKNEKVNFNIYLQYDINAQNECFSTD